MKTTQNQLQSNVSKNQGLFRRLFELQIELMQCNELDDYQNEVREIIQAIDDLFEKMIDQKMDRTEL